MKKLILILLGILACMWSAKYVGELAAEKLSSRPQVQTVPAATETVPETMVPETAAEPTTIPTEAVTEPAVETTAPVLLTFTEAEEELLLKLGMAERGETWCVDCIALVMRTVLNRVESPKFPPPSRVSSMPRTSSPR